jgi:hypothetical protein
VIPARPREFQALSNIEKILHDLGRPPGKPKKLFLRFHAIHALPELLCDRMIISKQASGLQFCISHKEYSWGEARERLLKREKYSWNHSIRFIVTSRYRMAPLQEGSGANGR